MTDEKIKTSENGQWKLVKSDNPAVEIVQEDAALFEKVELLVKELKSLSKTTSSDSKELANVKQKIGVTGYGSSLRIGSGPAMSGKPRMHNFSGENRTKSNKEVFSMHNKENDSSKPAYHDSFSAQDHKDAYYIHGNTARELTAGKTTHPDLAQHHNDMAKFHWNAYQNKLGNKEVNKTDGDENVGI
jgi:hypothetical protein